MKATKTRTFRLDDDEIDVLFQYDEASGRYFGDYPDFEAEPRVTPNGRPWRNVITEGCPYSDKTYNDCGSCEHFSREKPKDLIGVCFCDAFRTEPKEKQLPAVDACSNNRQCILHQNE